MPALVLIQKIGNASILNVLVLCHNGRTGQNAQNLVAGALEPEQEDVRALMHVMED